MELGDPIDDENEDEHNVQLGDPLDDDPIVDDVQLGAPVGGDEHLGDPLGGGAQLGGPLGGGAQLGEPLDENEPLPGEAPHAFSLHDCNLDELKQPLYEGCRMSMLGLIQRIIMNQMKGKVTQSATEDTMSLVHEICNPEYPRTYKQAKRLVMKTCLKNARQIHACIADCIVYYDSPFLRWHQYSKLTKCPRCGVGRYVRGTTTPQKIFEFIPLRDHMDALFCRPDVIARSVCCYSVSCVVYVVTCVCVCVCVLAFREMATVTFMAAIWTRSGPTFAIRLSSSE
jgi:hypothetical protein